MLKSGNQKSERYKGQSLVEFALIIPLLLVLIISAIEVGRLFHAKIVITNAAREGAYYLSTHILDYNGASNTAPNTENAAEAEAANSGISDISLLITRKNCCTVGQYSVVITVDTNVDDLLILGFLGNIFSISATNYNEFPLSSSVEMLVQ